MKIDNYFSDLKIKLDAAIENAKLRSKTVLGKLSEFYANMIDAYQDVSKVEEFKTLLLNFRASNDNAADDLLHKFILQHCQKSAANTQRIKGHLEAFTNLQKKFQTSTFQAA